MNPYVSTSMPTKGHPIKTIIIPPKNDALPFILCLWKKKLNVLLGPITHPSPQINRSCRKDVVSKLYIIY